MVDFLVLGRDGYEAPPGVAVTTVLPNVSSTEVRRRIAAGEPTWSMIAPAVRSIVDREQLYR